MNSTDWNPNPLSGSPSGLTGVLSIAVSPNGTQLAVGIDGPSHGLWLLQQDRQNTWRVTSRKSPGLPRACQFSPLDNLFAAAYQEIRFRQESLEIWTVDLQNKIPLAGSNDTWLTAISFANRRKETLVVADQQGEVRFLDCTSGRVTQTISTGIAVSCLAISLQDRRMAVIGDGRLQLWNLVVTPPAFRTVSVNARDAVFTPDGRWLITAGSQQTESEIAVWLVDEVRQIRTLKGHSGPVRKLALTRDGSILTSAGEDETVRLWRLLP
jgi:WD40 repeat protein